MIKSDIYPDGLDMKQFSRIHEISSYLFNYYIGYDGDLLFGKSDDDNTTEWYLLQGSKSYYLGESYCKNEDRLKRYSSPQT